MYISSAELEESYEELKALQDRAIESSTSNFNKKRSIGAELKLYREQKEEADRYQKLLEKKVGTLLSLRDIYIFQPFFVFIARA